MTPAARRAVALAHGIAVLATLLAMALVWRHNWLIAVLLALAAGSILSPAATTAGLSKPGSDEAVKGLMLSGHAEERARQIVSASEVGVAVVLSSCVVLLMIAVAGVMLFYHGPIDALTYAIAAHGAIAVLVVMVPVVILPYVIIAMTLKRKRRVP